MNPGNTAGRRRGLNMTCTCHQPRAHAATPFLTGTNTTTAASRHRHLIFNAEHNGFKSNCRTVGVLIDEASFSSG